MRNSNIALEIRRLREFRGERPVDINESERLRREMPYADSLPPYGGLFVSPDRTLWITDAVAPGDTVWFATAFSLSGTIVGRLRVSGNTIPVAFGNDRVLLRAEDADGIVSLRLHRIIVKQGERTAH